jgi:hypothetical protein
LPLNRWNVYYNLIRDAQIECVQSNFRTTAHIAVGHSHHTVGVAVAYDPGSRS